MNLGPLRDDADRRGNQRELPRPCLPGHEEHQRGKPNRDQEHRAGRELSVDEGFTEPITNAAALAPESERAQAIGIGALVVADRFLDHGRDDTVIRQRL